MIDRKNHAPLKLMYVYTRTKWGAPIKVNVKLESRVLFAFPVYICQKVFHLYSSYEDVETLLYYFPRGSKDPYPHSPLFFASKIIAITKQMVIYWQMHFELLTHLTLLNYITWLK